MVARKIVVTTQERLRREKCALPVRTPAFQNGTNYQGQPHVRFALEWYTPVTGFKVVEPDQACCAHPRSSNQNFHKSWDPANRDSVIAPLEFWRGNNMYGDIADSSYVQSNTCAGICDGSRLVRGGMSFYLLRGPTKSRSSVLP
jgi:hypothetical protein